MSRPPAALTRYREKRDFSQTPEPAGKTARRGQTLAFVVQRHAARRLHYDLRLEWRGVMKSWAVTRGPSLDPADKRLAVEVEDHPLDYASFEGTIPKPSYGGGTVQVWDRGRWAPLDPDTVDQDLAKGELKFVLSGERLNGGFVLVRMRPRRGESETHHNWLLIKERDSAATPGAGDAVLKAVRSVLSGRTMDEISAGTEAATEKNPPAKKARAIESTGENVSAKRSGTKRTPAKTSPKKPPTKNSTADDSAGLTSSVENSSAKHLYQPAKRLTYSRVMAFPLSRHGAGTDGRVRPGHDVVGPVPKRQTVRGLVLLAQDPPAKTSAAPPDVRKSRAATSAIPRFVSPQLCKLVDTPPTGDSWVHELKLDGYRLQLRVEAGKPELRTRTGLDWTGRFPSIAKAAVSLPDCLMDGEAVALDAKGHPSFAALQATLAGGQQSPIVYFVFDLLHGGKRDLRNEPLEERKRVLRSIVPENETVLRYLDHFSGPGQAVLASACELAMEGIVSKRANARYSSGRGDSWTKAKCRGRDEFLVGGWTKDKKDRGLGALLVGAHRGGELVYLGRVGTGFSATLAEDLIRRLTPLRTAVSPFAGRQPAKTSNVIWAAPNLVVEIAYGGWTEDEGLLRHASFQGVREDKPAEEVTPPETPEQPKPETAEQPNRTAHRPAGTLKISHPDRVLWPATTETPAVTKADLAAYYALYADRILSQVGGRPLSVIRAPDGITGQLFFQRHGMRGQSPLIGAVNIPGQAQPYLRVDDAPGLAALAQISAVELHPWGARADSPDIPDRLVFDLDPAEGLNFDAVIAAGLELRERLRILGLPSFARVTGGKGLHVVVPLTVSKRATPPGWPEAKQFARLVCVKMERDAPKRYTTTMAKQARFGKIFLDYLRNDHMATAIAGWSPRGRPGAPVARPVTWSAVKPGLDPAGWRLPAMLKAKPARDPWSDFATAGGDLRAAIATATKG